MPAYKNTDMMLRIKHYFEQHMSETEIATQISKDTGKAVKRSTVHYYVRNNNFKRNKIKLYEKK